MIQPVQNLSNARQFCSLRQDRSVDHQNWHAQRSGSVQFGSSPGSACVFGDDQLGPVPLHQRAVVRFGERSAIHNNLAVRQGQRAGRIHQPQQVVVLGLGCKVLKVHTPDRKENATRVAGQRHNRRLDIGNVVPIVTSLRRPGGAGQRSKLCLSNRAGLYRVSAHLGGKRVGCIDNVGYFVVMNVGNQSVNAAKTANPHRQRLRARVVHAPGIGIGRRHPQIRYGLGQCIRFGCTTKNQEVGHV